MSVLKCENLTVRRGACQVVDHVSFTMGPGELVGLIGPNGAGKTTLMRAALGLLPHEGRSSLAALAPEARAQAAAWMPQARQVVWPMRVADLVALGRRPHTRRAPQIVAEALAQTDLSGFADRRATELSGGEQARVLLARALAQDTPLLLVDEPAAGLDPAHQIAVMELFAARARAGRGVLVSLHDLGLAARHCTRLLVLQAGRLVADGPPREVLSADLLADIFGIRAWSDETAEGWMLAPFARAERG